MAIEDIEIEYVRNNYESGFDGARRLLRRNPRPSAIIAMNDQMAVSTLQAARSLGIDVPGQLSVVGTDNIDLSRIFDLTTCDSHLERQVEEAVDILRRTVLDGEEFEEPVHMTLPMELIVRGTTGPAPQ
jgi:LacI family transcriptional regulator